MIRTFIYSDDKSNKFWNIEINGNSYTVTFGKVDTDGQTQTKDFDDEALCLKMAEKVINEKTKKGYVEQSPIEKKTPAELESFFKEKYKDVPDNEAGKHYYSPYPGDPEGAMDRVLGDLQGGLNKAAKKWKKIKADYESPLINIYINEDGYTIDFAVSHAERDEDEGDFDEEEYEFYTHYIGESMAEALVLMQKMDNSGTSTPLSQALCNWAEDLRLGLFGCEYIVSDSWGMIEGFEGDDED